MTSLADAQAALQHIPPHDRETWVRLAMAVKSEFGEAGRETWESWSRGAENYRAADAAAVWRSAKESGGVTIATLFHTAKENGFDPASVAPPKPPTPAEIAQRKARAEAEQAKIEKRQAEAAGLALRTWAKGSAADGHPYLIRKGVQPTDTIRKLPAERVAEIIGYHPKSSGEPLTGDVLVIPVKVETLTTLEMIDETGRKAALYGGKKSGGLWSPAKLPKGDGDGLTLAIAEGVATTLSIHESGEFISIAALSAGNLPAVAARMRNKFPAARMVICGEPGGGLKHAKRAAQENDAALAVWPGGDANDLHQAQGLEAVRQLIEKANTADDCTEDGATVAIPPQPGEDFNDMASRAGLEAVRQCLGPGVARVALICAADIKPEQIRWIWPGWLAAGKLHVLAGAPGTGKSTLAFSLGATISNGGRWPGGEQAEPGDVVIWSGEDDPKDTIVPRLRACGANMGRVHILGGMTGPDPRPFDPSQDIPALRYALMGRNIRLLIVDPVVSAVAADSHKNTEVRRALQPLVDIATATGCAVLGISHFTKGTAGRDPVERVTGSLAFGALARVVMATAKLPEEEHNGARLLARAKSNIGPDTGGFHYNLDLVEIPDYPGIVNTRVLWGKAVDGAARDLLADAERDRDEGNTATGAAMQWLTDMLSAGPVKAAEVTREARAAGIGAKPLRSAREKLGVKPHKVGFPGQWWWSLEDAPGEDAPKMPTHAGRASSEEEELQDINNTGVLRRCPEDALGKSKMPSTPEDALPQSMGTFGASSEIEDCVTLSEDDLFGGQQ
ncbi:AAA family ATPase [Geoalkalibacter subterraneus]|uniref:AAA family ATPase n=1 Tax=Geoalkalibacter subterraneus TaxID=483547 RepID=UPI0006932E52|nr:AAA family ATPase [Geoalkalibacter subterraneus]